MQLRGYNLPEQWKEFISEEVFKLEKPLSIRLKELNILKTTALKYLLPIPEFVDWYDQRLQRTLSTRWAFSQRGSEMIAKRKETCLSKYGVSNPATLPEISAKRKETCIARFGGAAPAFSLEVRQKALQTSLQKYGKPHPNTLSETQLIERLASRGVIPLEPISTCQTFVSHRAKCSFCGKEFEFHFNSNASGFTVCPFCDCNATILEHNISDFIQSLGFKVVPHFRRAFVGTPFERKEIDIFVPPLNIGFEVNGAYSHNSDWHPFSSPKSSGYHLLKTEYALRNNIRLFHIWEHWSHNIIMSIVRAKLGKSDRIFARSLKFVEISFDAAKDFVESSHVHGFIPQSAIFALVDSSDIIYQVMSFRRTKTPFQFEISRLCSRINTNIVGGASKLLSHAIPILKSRFGMKSLISYAYRDLTPDNASVYSNLGFEFDGFTKPGLSFYIRSSIKTPSGEIIRPGVYSRQHFQTQIMIDKYDYPEGFSQRDLKDIGIFRLFDSGNLKYHLIVD